MTSVLHIATSPTGGAGIAARRLHDALRTAGVQSTMAVAKGGTADGDVRQMDSGAGQRSVMTRFARQRLRVERRLSSKAVSRKLAYFSDDRVAGANLLAGRPDADVLNLHWVAQFLDYGKFFSTITDGQPLVWTLHDMAPMTGGCHYAMDCARFTERCGACPLLGSPAERDLTRRIHNRKSAALGKLRPDTTRIVAPSHWLASEARRSSLLGQFDVDVIPNGLDTERFSPKDQGLAREALGLPQDGKIVLFAAQSVTDHRKGFDLLQAALQQLPGRTGVHLAALGSAKGTGLDGVIPLGRIENERVMSLVYSAADLFVLPTRAEAFGQVLAEAMACGVPCVSFDICGVPDVVRHEETGLLAPAEDVGALCDAIARLLREDELRWRLGQRSREVAVQEFSDNRVAEAYKSLYETLVTASRAKAGEDASA